jgi:hypothetical protein
MTPALLVHPCPDPAKPLPGSEASATSPRGRDTVLWQASKPENRSRVRGGYGRQKPGIFADFRKTSPGRHSSAAVRSFSTSAIHANSRSMEIGSDAVEAAKSNLFDTSSWGEFCDVTLTLRQGHQSCSGGWIKIEDYRCREAFRHFLNRLKRAVYGAAFRRHGKRLRVLSVLERGEVRARALRPWERGTSGRWHIHCAIELPSHFDAVALERMIRDCWAKVEWGHGRILVRDGANAGWIIYMLKDRQKSEFDGLLDCIIIESLHNPNPIAGA